MTHEIVDALASIMSTPLGKKVAIRIEFLNAIVGEVRT
jgi:hypothetical protein